MLMPPRWGDFSDYVFPLVRATWRDQNIVFNLPRLEYYCSTFVFEQIFLTGKATFTIFAEVSLELSYVGAHFWCHSTFSLYMQRSSHNIVSGPRKTHASALALILKGRWRCAAVLAQQLIFSA
jgi:hypothetical protein